MSDAFPLLFTLGTAASLVWLALRGAPDSPSAAGRSGARAAGSLYVDGGLAALGGGLLGARAAFVLLHWGYYSSRLAEAFAFWEGGLSWVGGAAGALLALATYAWALQASPWRLADELALPAAGLSFLGWVGCLLDGCGYGARAEAGWLTPPSADALGVVAPRWPAQSLGALLSLAIFSLLLWARPRLPAGATACLGLGLLAGASLGLNALRGDPTVMVRGLRVDGLADAALLLAAGVGFAARMTARR